MDDEYTRGLRLAVEEAVDYGIGAVESNRGVIPPIPPALLIQARLAARNRISLESALRRYIAGHALMTQFVIDEVQRDPSITPGLAIEVVQVIGVLLDLIVDAVSEEYAREARTLMRTTDQRSVGLVKRILGGELVFTDQFTYDFEGRHVGILAHGVGVAKSVRALAKGLDRRVLLVQPTDTTVWAWLEIRGEFDWGEFECVAGKEVPASATLAVGDLGEGIVGWRHSHEQARDASALAVRRRGTLVRYGPNNLRIAALKDDVFRASLEATYLAPLARADRGGSVLQDTVRSYLATGRNASSTAATLSVSRRTVTNRIAIAERAIGSTLIACGAALEVALWLEELEREPNSHIGALPATEI